MANTPTITVAGTFTVTLPAGATGTATSGGWTVTGSPVTLAAGANTITVQAGGSGTITVAFASPAFVVGESAKFSFGTRFKHFALVGSDGKGFRLPNADSCIIEDIKARDIDTLIE